jgi:queuine tRNA-ribosyltransferase
MSERTVSFELLHVDPKTGARLGRMTTPHGVVDTPTFMPVGTAATVKAMLPQEVESTGAQVVLGNTFHLYLRPGHKTIQKLGGLHKFSAWNKTILTDSGGFQVFSLKELRKITEEGVEFRSPFDGSKHFMTPELSLQVQEALGTDIAMAFDECPPHDVTRDYVARSMEMTTRWLDRCIAARRKPEQSSLFGIVQGGLFEDLRKVHAESLIERDLDGYAIGGVAIGESPEEIQRIVEFTAPLLPANKPRYLMGVGYPKDLVLAVARGLDMFDCVIPTRNARTGRVFTNEGYYSIKLAAHKEDGAPIASDCACPTCETYSRAYLRHLFIANEILGHRLLTMHNLWFYQSHMRRIRAAIKDGTFAEMVREAQNSANARSSNQAK